MANPVIDSITLVPNSGSPGTAAVLTVNAHDDDNRAITVNVSVENPGGTPVTGQATFNVVDALLYGATVAAGDGTVVQRAAPNQNIFDYQAPP